MLHPKNYRAFTLKHMGRVINHDDTILPDQLEGHIRQTTAAWQEAAATEPYSEQDRVLEGVQQSGYGYTGVLNCVATVEPSKEADAVSRSDGEQYPSMHRYGTMGNISPAGQAMWSNAGVAGSMMATSSTVAAGAAITGGIMASGFSMCGGF
ncbi:hypothetical protein DFQ30_006698 [Apophysomyces sp. BC1015]|nr:hypothetical protein DFQ30_006698 [Apophysomyces sp. BC1015]